jgi:two-component system NtrC family sensor kinase
MQRIDAQRPVKSLSPWPWAMDRNLKTPYYRSLTRTIVLIFIAVALAPMILVGGILDRFHTSSYRIKVQEHLQQKIQKHQQNIDGFLSERLANIRFIAESFSLTQLSNQPFLERQLSILQQGYGSWFVDLGLIDQNGFQVAYAGPFKLGKADYADAAWFKQAMAADHFISDVFLGLRDLPHFIVTTRIQQNSAVWVLRATIDFMTFNNLVENLRLGETGFAYILNHKKEFQTNPISYIHTEQPLDLDALFTQPPHAKTSIQIAQRPNRSGQEILYVTGRLKNGDWLLVFQQNTEDAYSGLRRTRQIAVSVLLLGSLAIIGMAILLTQRMVTRIAIADREKQLMNQQVIETGKLASVGELAAGIAHEINNPVAIMVEEAGWLKDLLADQSNPHGLDLNEFTRSLDQIRTQGQRCKEITHKLLSFARKGELKVQDLSINEVIEDAVGVSAQHAKFSNVVIEKHLSESLPLVRASHSEMQQVFLNLINNALQAMEKTGGTLHISSQLQDSEVQIEVADTGIGIAPANLQRIFDPFFTTKPVGKGTGLGLSICFGIIQKLGGRIEVKSVVDVGTCFLIYLPAGLPDAPEQEKRVESL